MISFESLPQEVLQDIVALLDPQSTVRCQGVCKGEHSSYMMRAPEALHFVMLTFHFQPCKRQHRPNMFSEQCASTQATCQRAKN